MRLYAGIDLHARQINIGISDEKDRRIHYAKTPAKLEPVLDELRPYQRRIHTIAVESTFNWYWLVDGLMDNDYTVRLAHPAAMEPYNGLKHRNDKSDAFFLAKLLRLGILPEGYIYPKENRPTRDLLRQRGKLVNERTSHINIIRHLSERIGYFEDLASKSKALTGDCYLLLTTPGIGEVLALSISLEVGTIKRFPKVGDYSSYCRVVKSEYKSAGKKKGHGNSRAGNAYLHDAYIQAAHCLKRHCSQAKAFYDRKKASTGPACAAVALANKLSKAHYHMLNRREAFDMNRLFA